MCDNINKDDNIDQQIIYSQNHELFFDEINRKLTSPIKKETEFTEQQIKKVLDDYEDIEYKHEYLKEKIDVLPDYGFKRLILFYYYYIKNDTSNEFRFWAYHISEMYRSEAYIRTFFNINYTILNEFINLEDLSLLLLMTKIGFDYNLFKDD
ncbi:16732_t:CDS:1 [Cetraspora pellucida]|uniref:16732_t:CDS:1 n=1 Tax=Cetraspora pellucida TaxID=1433469 RepID=A0A9N9KHN0_9GLOM|nr:16732_t:CDS:1 [Cetraspora pellucida]